MSLSKVIISIFLIIILFSCSPSTTSREISNIDRLKENILYLIKDPNLFNSQVGVYIESLDNGEIIFKHNERKLFISASNMKLYTTATALLQFGPDFQYETDIFVSNSMEESTVQGDIVIRGKGDPTIAPRYYDDILKLLDSWADSLLAAGIKVIDGDLIGDASYFQNPPLGAGWQWDYQASWYSAQISALSLNDNCIDVTVRPNKSVGESPLVSISPPTDYFSIENTAITTEADSNMSLFITRPRLKNVLLVRREIPVNYKKIEKSITVENPALFFVHVFSEVLAKKGIQLTGNILTASRVGDINYNDYKKILTHKSPKLDEIITTVNKSSQNLYAEQLLLTLAAEYGKFPSAGEGVNIVTSRLGTMGIPETEFRMQDGSGLARKNLISPYATSALLRYMSNHKYFSYYYKSLPIGGVDGSLRNRMKGTSAVDNVRAKTGYVEYARNLSGYVSSQENEKFVFSILVNNYTQPTPAINLLQDRICALLSDFRR